MQRGCRAALAAAVVLMAATAAFAQPQLTIGVTAPDPTPTWTFTSTSGDPVAFNQSSGVATTFAWSTDVWPRFRIGWDVLDPADPDDPGWVNQDFDPALTSHTGPAFSQGTHAFLVVARDAVDAETWARFLITYEQGVPTAVVGWGGLRALLGAPGP